MKKEIGYDKRPRFGWCDDLDKQPQKIVENKSPIYSHPVVVIPLPFMSPKTKALFREFTKGFWSKFRKI
jgi:hypothetical protein